MKWYEPDTRWNLYAKDKEDFVQKFVVVGKFHKDVPEDIEKSFETATYLFAHSFYHWPMFDEAMSKVLLIMEMAVKLKAKSLGISFERTLRSGKVQPKKLIDISNEVFEQEELAFLKPDFDRAREFRNIKMHPEHNHFMGALGFSAANARLFMNTMNLLFLETKQLITLHKEIECLRHKLLPFENGLHVLQFKNTKILIDGFHLFKYREFENNKFLILYINPLTTTVYEQFIDNKYPEPLIITFINYTINEDSIEGIDLEGKPMKIYVDDKTQNLQTYYEYNMALSKISEADIHRFLSSNSSRALWKIERILYENLWSDKTLKK